MLNHARNLGQHNVKVLFWANLFAGVNFLEPVLTLFYLNRGLEVADLYWVTLVWCATILLFEVPTGAFADRFGPKASFLTGCALAILSKVVLIYAVGIWPLAIYSFLWAVSVTFFSGAEESLLYESLKETGEEHKMSEVMGKMYSAAFYPMIGAFLFGAYWARDLQNGQFVTLIVLSLAFQIVQFLLLTRVINPKSFDSFRDNPFQHVKNGVGTIRKSPNLWRLFLNVTIVFVPSVVVVGRLEQPYLELSDVPVAWFGVLYAGGALISLLFSNNVAWFTKRFSNVSLLFWTGIGTAVALMTAAFLAPALFLGTFWFFVLRLTRAVRDPIFSQMSNDMIPSESRATTLSLLSIGDSAFDVLFLTTFGTLAMVSADYVTVFAACAVFVLIGTLIPVREVKPQAESQAVGK